LAEFLTLVEGAHDLEDDLWLLLKQATIEHYGKSLAVSAARGKLGPSSPRLTVPLQEEGQSHDRPVPAATIAGANGDAG
jgi:hypothetical protein